MASKEDGHSPQEALDTELTGPNLLGEVRGYLKKRSDKLRWQRRWFVVNDLYLMYFKEERSTRMLACIDLRVVLEIALGDGNVLHDEPPETFFVRLQGERVYVMRASSAESALQWVDCLRVRQQRSRKLVEGPPRLERLPRRPGLETSPLLSLSLSPEIRDPETIAATEPQNRFFSYIIGCLKYYFCCCWMNPAIMDE